MQASAERSCLTTSVYYVTHWLGMSYRFSRVTRFGPTRKRGRARFDADKQLPCLLVYRKRLVCTVGYPPHGWKGRVAVDGRDL